MDKYRSLVVPLIVVTNDDGMQSSATRQLAEALVSIGEVYMVVPEHDQSGVSHALTTNRPLRWRELSQTVHRAYAVDGTPSDCVYFAASHLLAHRDIDIVVSGINDGFNLADDVTYSGTVAAAIEASLLGIPGIALSLERAEGNDISAAIGFSRMLVSFALANPQLMPSGTFLSCNIPSGTDGIAHRITTLGRRAYSREVQLGRDPKGREYFWIGGRPMPYLRDPESECSAIFEEGVISVTPIRIDCTDRQLLGDWQAKRICIENYPST